MIAIWIFIIIWGAMIATSFWEAYVEGKHAWADHKLGWKLRYKKYIILTGYHFWLFFVMYPLLLSLPLVVSGFSWRLFGIIGSAYFSGLIIEDFFWFLVNPAFKFDHYSSKYVKWYPWLKIGEFEMPLGYLIGSFLSLLFWILLWK
jgi:hypothetical protein